MPIRDARLSAAQVLASVVVRAEVWSVLEQEDIGNAHTAVIRSAGGPGAGDFLRLLSRPDHHMADDQH